MRLLVLFSFVLFGFAAAKKTCLVENELGCIRFIGGSGWIEFCPPGNSSSTTNSTEGDTECTRIRPKDFEELDDQNKSIRAISNLGNAITFTSSESGTFPKTCSSSQLTCATDNLGFKKIAFSADLSGVYTGAKLNIVAYIFDGDGTVTFGSNSIGVLKGSFKFNIEITGYKFCGESPLDNSCKKGKNVVIGKQLALKMYVKQAHDKENKVKKDKDGTQVGDIDNFPQFFADGSWKSTETTVDTKGSQTEIQYTFEGPFGSMTYDPFVATQVAPSVTGDSAPTDSSSSAPIVGGICAGILVLAIVLGVIATRGKSMSKPKTRTQEVML